ncbi:MAG: protein-L-isoaspartate(D-aspartate) O-methyltransferase [Parasphingopyxis sp.]|uniref:protein-L-isoaspartate(D-aspartate) O-methyltransferase n=1 Tax=Parasphingopyxis sp. TaxID=1920299 RepID=UPI0032EEB959
MSDFASRRQDMVENQIARRGVRDPQVLTAMREVPREQFVDPEMSEFAYEDSALPIGEGQTISQPYIVAKMIACADLGPGDKVLEVGAGSGYAAAVLSRIARAIYAIELHETLLDQAQRRLRALRYTNIGLRLDDGSKGWPEAAPFDAILVAAGGPSIPQSLKDQLAIGGRLIIPVGETLPQRLIKVVRMTETDYEELDLGAVNFVPLIGEQGWLEDGSRAACTHVPGAVEDKSLPDLMAEAAEPLPAIDNVNFGSAFDSWANRRVVMLGEASHGTSDFYRARAAITRHLVEEHGFTIIAVEADWPDAAAIDRYIRHRGGGRSGERPFQRFPSWMWRNTDIAALVEWLRARNEGIEDIDARAGFFGLDLYNMRGSIAAVLDYLDEVDPKAAATARERYGCLTPWQNEPATYGRAVLTDRYRKCENAVVEQCRALLEKKLDYAASDSESFLDAAQNARLIASAERYYRVMYYGGADSWNLRDSHMFETLENLLEAKGPDAKAIVWAHNSHIGDARATEMGAVRKEHNIGQLARQKWGEEVALIGFGTHSGTVSAATDWDGEMEAMRVRPSHSDSYERICHDVGTPCFLLDLSESRHEALRRRLMEPRLERFIGVIYRPETELQSHYSQAVLPDQFDGYVWLDKTEAVTPLGEEDHPEDAPDTYPFGL